MRAEIRNRQTFSGLLLLNLVLAVILIIVFLMPLEPSDYWTYLRIGEEIARTRALPETEFMSFASGGQAGVYSYWLASLLFLGVSQAGGLALTALVTGVCVVTLYAFVWLCLREFKLGPVSAALILLLTALMGSNNWSTRPQVFALPLFGASLYLLVHWLKGQSRTLWFLPVIAVLWTNLHGSFVLLFILMGSALVAGGGKRKILAWVLLACLAATLLNPYGIGIWGNTFAMIGNDAISKFSSEWQPPVNLGWQMNLFFASFLVIILVSACTKQKVKPLWWVWFLGFGWMALSSLRYVLWFSVLVGLLLAQLSEPWLTKTLDRKPILPIRAFNLALALLLLGSTLAFLPGIRQRWWVQAPENLTSSTPVEAAAWLRQHPDLPDNVWANWAASIYMSYAVPERKVWMTNRIEDYEEQVLEDNKRLARAAYDWAEILEGYEINTLLLDQEYDERLLEAALLTGEWQPVYQDEKSQILIRQGSERP